MYSSVFNYRVELAWDVNFPEFSLNGGGHDKVIHKEINDSTHKSGAWNKVTG